MSYKTTPMKYKMNYKTIKIITNLYNKDKDSLNNLKLRMSQSNLKKQ